MKRHDRHVRVGAYAVLVDERQRILLALWNEGPTPAWTVPGGGVEEGETPEEAAVREVREETGYHGALREELSPVEYTDPKGRPKTVRYWRMDVLDGEFEPNDEVDQLRWLGLDDALQCLTYDHDRDLVLMAMRHAADNQ